MDISSVASALLGLFVGVLATVTYQEYRRPVPPPKRCVEIELAQNKNGRWRWTARCEGRVEAVSTVNGHKAPEEAVAQARRLFDGNTFMHITKGSIPPEALP